MKLFTVTLFFKLFARYPSLYVLGAFPAWLKALSRNFGAVLLKKPKNVRDSVPLMLNKDVTYYFILFFLTFRTFQRFTELILLLYSSEMIIYNQIN